MSRLSIEIEREQHQRIKVLASLAGMSIKDFILSRALLQNLDSDESGVALAVDGDLANHSPAENRINVKDHLAENLKELQGALGLNN